MIETTYERYQRVLREIADGADDPKALANAALCPRKTEPTYKWKIEAASRRKLAQEKRHNRAERAKAAYLDWLKTGRVPIARYARSHGVASSTMLRLLTHGERKMQLPWQDQRLRWGNRNRNYDTAREIEATQEKQSRKN